jgi:hypothetical protein
MWLLPGDHRGSAVQPKHVPFEPRTSWLSEPEHLKEEKADGMQIRQWVKPAAR